MATVVHQRGHAAACRRQAVNPPATQLKFLIDTPGRQLDEAFAYKCVGVVALGYTYKMSRAYLYPVV
ncbi:hypothetical protein [Pyrobaculum sp.]|uniref:hypothetical protein n=1 Tax=Pyrobaculum sp. TaxID=2004705 RepID=UPI003D0E9E3B